MVRPSWFPQKHRKGDVPIKYVNLTIFDSSLLSFKHQPTLGSGSKNKASASENSFIIPTGDKMGL
jgi:hypothetical protein